MTNELRKRLEEAAEEYTESQDYIELENEFLMDEEGTCITRIYRDKQVEDSFLAGAEWGYKEAIAQAKDVLRNVCYEGAIDDEFANSIVLSFEADMNKLWEGEK